MKKDQVNESKETIEATKVKEESLEFAGGKCWKNIGMKILSVTGELQGDLENHRSHYLLSNVLLVTFIFKEKKSIFMNISRDLDLAYCCSFGYGYLRCPCNRLLQQLWLISIFITKDGQQMEGEALQMNLNLMY